MAKTYAQLQKQIESLSTEAEKLRRKEMADVIGRIKEAISVYGLTATDLGFTVGPRTGPAKSAGTNNKPAGTIKYRDDAGNSWSGRGPRPQWLRNALASGKALEDFAG